MYRGRVGATPEPLATRGPYRHGLPYELDGAQPQGEWRRMAVADGAGEWEGTRLEKSLSDAPVSSQAEVEQSEVPVAVWSEGSPNAGPARSRSKVSAQSTSGDLRGGATWKPR